MHTFGQARPGIYPWTIEIKVVDDAGQPLNAAKVEVGYALNKQVEGLTDSNGSFKVSRTDRSWELGIRVQKQTYYLAYLHYDLYLPGQFDDQKVAANRNTTLMFTLKKIIKPIPLYAKHIEAGPPVYNQPVGYDLMIGDWVSPYGKGVNTDIIFDGEINQKAKNDFDYKLTISFPDKGDGIQEFNIATDDLRSSVSELRSIQEAPTNDYQSTIIRTMSRHPGQGAKEDMYDQSSNYYFRVRTKADDRGNIVSAHYGKIYGDFMQFSYYFNPTPNDRNVEFDPKENLMANLKFDEGVSQP
jgi:hypothetical protein